MSTHYPLKLENTPFGPLLTPYVKLELSTVYGWRPYWFLVDTGADYTVLPESLAKDAGVDLSRCIKEYAVGIEGRPIPAKVGSITVRLGSEVLPLRCHILKADETPCLLGRMDVCSRFNIFLYNNRRRISFVRISG